MSAISVTRWTPVVVLLTHTHHDDSHLGPHLRVHTAGVLDCPNDALELWVGGAVWIWERSILGEFLLEVLTLLAEHCGITSVIDDLVRAICARPRDNLLGAPPALGKSHTHPCRDGRSVCRGNGCTFVVLGAELVQEHQRQLAALATKMNCSKPTDLALQ